MRSGLMLEDFVVTDDWCDGLWAIVMESKKLTASLPGARDN
jgi:hypothetical protein